MNKYLSMKAKFLPFILIFLALKLSAQLNTPNVIASAGGYFSNSNFSNSYTIGEMCVVETAFINGDMLTQGFQQPDYEVESDVAREDLEAFLQDLSNFILND